MTHTPGPWRVEGNHCAIVTAGNFLVVDCGDASKPGGITQARANASLIAAAPDMLEALNWIADHATEFGDIEDFEKQVFEITQRARRAIAKAQGKENPET